MQRTWHFGLRSHCVEPNWWRTSLYMILFIHIFTHVSADLFGASNMGVFILILCVNIYIYIHIYIYGFRAGLRPCYFNGFNGFNSHNLCHMYSIRMTFLLKSWSDMSIRCYQAVRTCARTHIHTCLRDQLPILINIEYLVKTMLSSRSNAKALVLPGFPGRVFKNACFYLVFLVFLVFWTTTRMFVGLVKKTWNTW